MPERLQLEDYYHKINAFIPVYRPGIGNLVCFYLKDGGSGQCNLTVRSFLNRLAYYYAIDLKALRNQGGKVLNRRLNLPLPLGPGFTLIPLRVRQPKFSKDGANGYVCLQEVAEVIESDNPPFRSAVILKSGKRIFSLSQQSSVLSRLRDGEYLTGRSVASGQPGYSPDLIPPKELIQTISELIKLYNRFSDED